MQKDQSYSPEVVNQHVEHAEQNNQNNSAPLGLEANNDHDARDQTKQTDQHAPEAPGARENEANEEEDEQDTASKLHVHLAVLLVKLGQTGRNKLLAHPRVRQHHKQTADNTQVTQEEVQVEDETVAHTLCDNDGEQSRDGVLGALAGDNQGGANGHSDDVDDQEEVCEAPGNCRERRETELESIRGARVFCRGRLFGL